MGLRHFGWNANENVQTVAREKQQGDYVQIAEEGYGQYATVWKQIILKPFTFNFIELMMMQRYYGFVGGTLNARYTNYLRTTFSFDDSTYYLIEENTLAGNLAEKQIFENYEFDLTSVEPEKVYFRFEAGYTDSTVPHVAQVVKLREYNNHFTIYGNDN